MSENTHEEAKECIFTCCNRNPETIERETYSRLSIMMAKMSSAARAWQKPSEIENQLENARKKIREAERAIAELDNYAKSLARLEADRNIDNDFQATIIEIDQSNLPDDVKTDRINQACSEWLSQDRPEWVDHAALGAMERLHHALSYPIEKAIPNTSTGSGRPPNRRAYLVAEYSYLIFQDLTGSTPTYWNGGETPFSRMVTGLYRIYGIRATLRKPIEAAMHKYKV